MDTYKLCYGLLFICEVAVLYCNCQTTTLTPIDPEVIEGDDVTFVCTVVSGTVDFVNWQVAVNASTSYVTPMAVPNGACAVSQTTSILTNKAKYSYECNSTVYQVTVKNVQRSQHNVTWSCFPQGQASGPTSTINVQFPVSSVSITPASTDVVDVEENTGVVFTCQTSEARPNASVTWYKVESGVTAPISQNITTSTTYEDFSVTTSILRFVPSTPQNGLQIFCKAKNSVNISPEESSRQTLNVL
ncbi:glomerular basement membrane development [Mactra antiquata]